MEGGVERRGEIGFNEVLMFFFFNFFKGGEDYMAKLKMNTLVCGFQRTPILDNIAG